MSDLKNGVASIVEFVGGQENIQSVTHCVTRLRFLLKNQEQVDTEKLEELDIVKGSFLASGQFQVVIGPGLVDKAYDELLRQTNLTEASKEEVKELANQNQNMLQRGVRLLADIFIPILPAIVASGLLMGINNMLSNPGIFSAKSVLEINPSIDGVVGIINVIANTSFSFLPALIGWSAVKKFGGNPVLGIVLGLVLVHPSLVSAYDYVADPSAVPAWNLFGLNVAQVGYQGQVLPVLFAAFILAKIEVYLKRVIPDTVQLILVSPLALTITGFITFIFIGPVTMAGANLITEGIVRLFDVAPTLAGAIYGFISPPLVITGMHHLFLGVNLQMAGTLGYVTLWPIGETVTMAQAIACITMFFLLRKNKKMQGIAVTSTVSALLGITEPAIYGVNLRYRYPFIAVMVGSAAGSAFLAFQGVKATSVGVGGIFSFLSVFPEFWGSYFIGYGITAIITITLTLVLSKTKLASGTESTENAHASKSETLSPM